MPDSLRSIHVVAGIVTDPRGRILLTRRTEGRDMAGLWEFPGGKREPGESSEQALVRELHEELGIEAQVGAALMEVPQLYPDKRLRLEVCHVTRWKGAPRGREGQALAWVASDKLSRYCMPPADQPVVAALRQPDHYLVTPEPEEDAAWLAALSQALSSGVRRVQLRTRHLQGSERWERLVTQAVALCRRETVEVLLNRDIGLAQKLGIGVHLGSEQLKLLETRPLSENLPVAASCHGLEELRTAQQLGCDFAMLGPVRETATHPQAKPLGWDGFVALRERTALPLYAIGGMGSRDIPEARRQGAQGIAAIRGLWPGQEMQDG